MQCSIVHAVVFVCLFLLLGTALVMGDSEEEKLTLREYKALVGKIGGHKAFLTKVANSASPYIDAEQLDGEQRVEADQVKVTIEQRLSKLQDMFDELLENTLVTEKDITDFELYIRGIRSKLAKLKFKLLVTGKVKVEEAKSPVKPGKLGWGESAVKYPELTLPKFKGGETGERDFRPFRQLFEALVGQKTEIPIIYKLQYLRDCLPDGSEAKQLIEHIPPTEENYDMIMATLISRYGNEAGEANRLRRRLMEVGEWPVCNTVESQRRLIDHVTQHLVLLDQIEQVKDEEMATLALHMLSVVPERIRYKTVKLPKEERNVKNIIKILEIAIKNKLEVQSLSPNYGSQAYGTVRGASSISSSQTLGTPKGGSNSRSNTSTHFSNNQGGGANKCMGQSGGGMSNARLVQSCPYCKKSEPPHKGHFCKEKPNAERCKIILIKEGRCLNCLDKGHMVRDCTLESQCNCEKGKHSPSICFRGGKRRTSRNGSNCMAFPNGSCPSFMETALAQLVNPQNGKSCKARIFIDRGSTDSYCTEKLAKQLGCEPLDNQTINIGTFAADRTKSVASSLVGVGVAGLYNNKTIHVQLLTMGRLCGDLPSNPLGPEEMRQLKPFQLADYPATQCSSLTF